VTTSTAGDSRDRVRSAPRRSNNGQAGQVKELSFRVRTLLELDPDLAYDLGCFILDNNPANPAILAIGHRLAGD
jgi:hypothetical protein